MVLGQLLAATTQDRDAGGGQLAPPHPAVTAIVLDCVPALAASARAGVQEQELQDPHWQFLGALPVQSRRVFVSSGQCSLHVLVCSPDAPQVFGEQVLQGVHTHGHGFVPVFCLLVEQSPVLQPALQLLVWVKTSGLQTSVGERVHGASPHSTHLLVPLTLRLVEQSPALQPALQLLVWVRV